MLNEENIPSFEVDGETNQPEVSAGIENDENVTSFEVEGETKQPEVSAGIQFGIENHEELKGRNLPNQHPISSISGLQEALDSKLEDGEFITKDDLDKKQDTIEDLEEIRQGAEKGKTAVQPNVLDEYATKQELDQKQPKGDYALKSELPVIPTKVSAFENDKGYLTEHQDISELATKQELNGKQDEIEDLEEIRQGSKKGKTAVQPDALNNYATKQELNGKQDKGDYALKAEIPDISGKQDKITDLEEIRQGASKGETAVQPDALNNYATTKSLTDGLATKQPVGDYATKTELNGKQDTITDLSAIRTGAEKGSTAVQPDELPTKTSELENDSGFITIASLSGYATQDWVQGLGYITGITASDVTTALKYTPLKQSDLNPYAKTITVQGWLKSKQDKLTAGEGITIDDDNVISATGGGGGGDVVEAISGQSIYPYEIVMTREWENPYRMQNVYLGGDFGLAVDDVLELSEASVSKSFNISNSERETEFTISSNNNRYDSYFRFNSNQLYIDFTDNYGNMRNLTISLRYGTVYYSDSERGDFELDLYDVMEALNNIING